MSYQKQQLEKTCGVCGTSFVGNSKRKYCSQVCAEKKQQEQLQALAEKRSKCPHCGKTIEPPSGRRRRHS